MKKIINTPQLFFIVLALLLIVSGLINKGGMIKIAMYGTFLDLKVWSIALTSALFFVLIAINYFSLSLTNKVPKRGLTLIHIILQIIALIPFLYFIYTTNTLRTYDEVSRMNLILIFSFFLFIIATIIHLINFVASLLSKKD